MRKAIPLLVILSFGLLGADCGTRFKSWAYERGDRDSWQQPERVVETLGLEPGQRVGDVGSGSGYFTRYLARAVAPGGRVYAVDVDEKMNELLKERMADEGIENVFVILATADDSGLPAGSIDLIFTSNTFHHLPDQGGYFTEVKKALAPGGRVAIVEYDPEKAGWFASKFDHATPPDEIKSAMATAGFRLTADHTFLVRQSFLVFTPDEGDVPLP